jgi:hypothetical protein
MVQLHSPHPARMLGHHGVLFGLVLCVCLLLMGCGERVGCGMSLLFCPSELFPSGLFIHVRSCAILGTWVAFLLCSFI